MTNHNDKSGYADGIIPMIFGVAVVVSLLVVDKIILPKIQLQQKSQ